jgi:nitroreductase
MNIKDLITNSRTRRRFDESYRVEYEILEQLVGLARLSPSGGNKQPLKFLICNTKRDCGLIFPYTTWAAYLKDWPGPKPGERPSAYIIILGDTQISESFGVDHGIAAQSIMLGATEAGIGGCIIQSINREGLQSAFNIPPRYVILLVLALGKPVENVIIDEIKDQDVKYWRDSDKTHHVPKRNLDELILKF